MKRLVFLWLIFAPTVFAQQQMPNYNIGVVFPMSGPQAPYGEEALRGLDLAIERITRLDPEFAKHLNVIKVDDKSLAEQAGKATEELFTKKRAHVVFGSLTSSSTLEMAKVARAEKRPLLTPIATSSALTEGGFVFRSCFSEDFQGALLAAFAVKDLRQKQAAILRDDTQSAKEIADKFSRTFQKGGGQITKEIVYEVGTEDFKKQLMELKSAGGKWVLLPAHYRAAAAIMQQAKELGIGKHFLGLDSWDSPALAKLAGPEAKEHYFTSHFATDIKNPAVAEFVTAFKGRYGREPGAIAALTYDGFNLLADVLKRAKTL